MRGRQGQRRDRRGRLARVLLAMAGLLVLLVVAALAGVGWYYADEILLVEDAALADYDLTITKVNGASITLSGQDADADGVLGLEWDDGYALVEAPAQDGVPATRELVAFPDTPQEGDAARLDGYAAPAEPTEAFDFDVAEIPIPGPLGDYPAYFVEGEVETWVLFVHGRGAARTEAFRLLPAVVERGNPALAISYRNDEGAPADPDGEYGLGWTEAADLAAAVDHALAQGADDVVLVGYSMGAAVVGNYLRTAPPGAVRAVVYDAPLLVWDDALRLAAVDRGVPTWLAALGQAVVTARTGIRFDLLDQVSRADELRVPVLLFHGTADATVPVGTSDALAAARPDIVTYERLDDVGHVRAWNHDPARYESAVDSFLDDVGA